MSLTRNDPNFSVSIIVDHDKCIAAKGCRTCIEVCPTDILKLDDSGKVVMVLGGYNKTLTPFGFQNERRSFWAAPKAYDEASSFFHADKINEPL